MPSQRALNAHLRHTLEVRQAAIRRLSNRSVMPSSLAPSS